MEPGGAVGLPGGTDAKSELLGGISQQDRDEDVVFGVRQTLDIHPADVHQFAGRNGSRRRVRNHLQPFKTHQKIHRRRSQSIVLQAYN